MTFSNDILVLVQAVKIDKDFAALNALADLLTEKNDAGMMVEILSYLGDFPDPVIFHDMNFTTFHDLIFPRINQTGHQRSRLQRLLRGVSDFLYEMDYYESVNEINLRDILSISKKTYLSTVNFCGRKTLVELESYLARFGLKLKEK